MLRDQTERRLAYPASALFDLAAAVERYPQYLPGWISARITGEQADVRHAEQWVGFGPVRMRFRFRSKAGLHRPHSIEVTSDDPQFRRMRLLWQFDDGQDCGCRVCLSIELELRSRLLQHGLEQLAARAAPEVLRAFERRARQVLAPRRLPGVSADGDR